MQKRNKIAPKAKSWGRLDLEKAFRDAFGEDFITQEEIDSKLGSAIAIAREKGHKFAKRELGGRVQVLRVLVASLHHQKRDTMTEMDFTHRVEKYLDTLLVRRNYLVETAIDEMRKKVSVYSSSGICHTCGYVKPFCPH